MTTPTPAQIEAAPPQLTEVDALIGAAKTVVHEYLSPGSIGSRVEAAIYELRNALTAANMNQQYPSEKAKRELVRLDTIERCAQCCKQLIQAYGPDSIAQRDRDNICGMIDHYVAAALKQPSDAFGGPFPEEEP